MDTILTTHQRVTQLCLMSSPLLFLGKETFYHLLRFYSLNNFKLDNIVPVNTFSKLIATFHMESKLMPFAFCT